MRAISGGNINSAPHERTSGLRAGGVIGEYYTVINSWMRGLVVVN